MPRMVNHPILHNLEVFTGLWSPCYLVIPFDYCSAGKIRHVGAVRFRAFVTHQETIGPNLDGGLAPPCRSFAILWSTCCHDAKVRNKLLISKK